MNAPRTLLSAATLILGLFATANSAKADHLHDLAEDMEGMAARMTMEFRAHYRYLPEYRHLAHDAARVARLAHHIHDMTDIGENLEHIHDDLHQLDDLYHHLEETLDRVEMRRGFSRGTRHVRGLMNVFHDTLEHMLEDVEELRAPPPPRHGGRRPGFQIQFGLPFGR